MAWIYEAVKRAIRDEVPSAIQDALGWHFNKRLEYQIKEFSVEDGYEHDLTDLKIEAKEFSDLEDMVLEAPVELKYKPKHKILKKIIRRTFYDQSRFNPVTGDNDFKRDENPLVEFFDWSEEAEYMLKEELTNIT